MCKYTALRYTTLITLHYNYSHTALHYTNYTTLQLQRQLPLHYATPRYTTLHYIMLHYITLH